MKLHRIETRRRLFVSAALVAMTATAATPATGEDSITPPQVYQAVAQVTADIGLVRAVMGRPVLTSQPWIVEEAEPRHVFYQAQTLFRKSNRLAQEIAGSSRQSPTPAPEGEIQPAHVFAVVAAAQAQITTVRQELAIGLRADLPVLEPERQPRDVLQAIVQASRQLNLLLDRSMKPEDVYDRLHLATTYVAGALTRDDDEPLYGTLPPFEPAKVPGDVYRRVLECLQLTTTIGEKRGISVLRPNLRRELRRKDIAPSDVFDVATTVLSELAFLTLELDAKDVPPTPLEKPKHVFPSHVYQLAGMLQDELAKLEESVD